MKLDRMALADLGEPTRLATAILDQFSDIPIPVPVDEIALALDITDIQPLETEGFEGGLIAPLDKSEGVILVNAKSAPQRRRFTVGHELGHFVNPWHVPKDGQRFLCSAADMRRATAGKGDRTMQMEVEANRFSAELLLPRATFQRDLRRSAGAGLEHVLRLSVRYDMSKEATAIRYVDLHDEPQAVIFSQDGKVRYPYRNSGFPFVNIRKGDPLPTGCSSLSSTEHQDLLSDWAEVDAGVWLDSNCRHRIVFEQTLAQANGFRMTILTIDEAGAEDADEELELEASWTPHHRR